VNCEDAFGSIYHELAWQRGSSILVGHLLSDHVRNLPETAQDGDCEQSFLPLKAVPCMAEVVCLKNGVCRRGTTIGYWWMWLRAISNHGKTAGEVRHPEYSFCFQRLYKTHGSAGKHGKEKDGAK
jgi:hypothetical protein